jgi:hypothetical protein
MWPENAFQLARTSPMRILVEFATAAFSFIK